jgi:long-subunit fatty acid transport protein
MRYGTEGSGLNGAPTRQTFRVGLNVVQGITPKLSFTGGLNYQNNFYNEFDKQDESPEFYENIIEFALGANFKMTKDLILQGGYTYTIDMAPASEQLSYQRNVAFVGMDLAF